LTAAFGHSPGSFDAAATTGFAARSPIRLVSAEPAVGLLLLRALTMEVAHAKVGAAVSEHSSFERYPIRRAWATTDAALRLVWGSPEMARGAAAQINRFHDRVYGVLRHPAAAWPAGTRYAAHDADLLLWVWATLVETAQVAHSRWLQPLEGAPADAYYADMRTFACTIGVPPAIIPPDRHAFAAYIEAMMAGEDLKPTPASADMVERVLWFHHRHVPGLAVRPGRVLAIGTLDPRLCERFGLALSAADQALFDLADGQLRRWYRYRPEPLVQLLPAFYVAVRGPWLAADSWLKALKQLPGFRK
jgi:uncharacterized protein (DUF2236 family)